MDFIYFLVTSSGSWDQRFHENFFIAQGGFLWGVVGALVIGAIVACAFYFGCCNSKETGKYAKKGIWYLFMLACAAVSYIYADFVIIGDSKTTDKESLFRKYSFYQANEDFYIAESGKPGVSQTYLQDLSSKKADIKGKLDKGGDVRFDFDITTALLAVLVFFLTSIGVKRFTINGRTIPFEKP